MIREFRVTCLLYILQAHVQQKRPKFVMPRLILITLSFELNIKRRDRELESLDN
jgi:hypothetical protein